MGRNCLLPFSNLVINQNGCATPCCKYNLNFFDKEILKETLYDNNIEELFYQPAMETIREQFRNGIEPAACQVCWDEEDNNILSMRQLRNNIVDRNSLFDLYKDKIKNPKIVTLDFKFSSLCNLKCRICGPYCSSTWLKESSDIKQFSDEAMHTFSKYAERKFIDNEENFEIFKKLIPNLHIIEFYGGEPLMQPEHDRIFDILNNMDDIKNLALFYNTNGTFYKESVFDVWKKTRFVELNISIDDLDERFHYQRYPADWNQVSKNIEKYAKNSSNNVNVSLYCTVSLYNIFYIDEFIKFNTDHWKLPLRFNLLHHPSNMSISNLPDTIKNIIKEKIDNLNIDHKKYVNREQGIEPIIDFMMNTRGSEEQLKSFIEITSKHDRYRTQSFELIFPEFYNLLKSYI